MSSSEKPQNIANELFSKLGNSNYQVLVKIIRDPKRIAWARGVKLPILNLPFGEIHINTLLLNELARDCLRFVLAHEAVHIDQNHLPMTILLRLPKEMIDELGKKYPVASAVSSIWDLIKLWIYRQGGLPPEAAIAKEQELQADVWAIFLTGNKTSAITCLQKLVKGDLTQPSHEWEALDIKLPVMTMRERIDEIVKRISLYESRGYRFT